MTRLRISTFTFFFGALLIGAPFLAMPTIAQAGAAFYVDTGGSITHINEPEPFYGSGASSAAFGYGLNAGIFTTFTERSPSINLQFGLEDRYTSSAAANPGDSMQFMAAYPVLRLQMSRLFFSVGATPLVWKGETLNGVSTSLTTVSGTISYLGEAGLLMPITPKFSFGASGSGEWVDSSSTLSPKPIISGNFFMRFNFGIGSGEFHDSSEFRGWRYPFGRDM
jgi:hypothetical protein